MCNQRNLQLKRAEETQMLLIWLFWGKNRLYCLFAFSATRAHCVCLAACVCCVRAGLVCKIKILLLLYVSCCGLSFAWMRRWVPAATTTPLHHITMSNCVQMISILAFVSVSTRRPLSAADTNPFRRLQFTRVRATPDNERRRRLCWDRWHWPISGHGNGVETAQKRKRHHTGEAKQLPSFDPRQQNIVN